MTNEERAVVAVNAAATALSGNTGPASSYGWKILKVADEIYGWLLKKENGG